MIDVFLSHSHRDKARAERLVGNFEKWNITFYLDCQDRQLSLMPDKELAEHLASKLGECHILVYAFSEQSLESRWMPWELGLAHGTTGRAVLWPFTKRALQAKSTQEYLHLYEVLDQENGAFQRLNAILNVARRESTYPRAIKTAERLGQISVEHQGETSNPVIATEFGIDGPIRLYSAWLNAIASAWKVN